MPRRKSLSPTTEYHIFLSEENAAMVEVLTYDPERKRHRFGEVSRIANEAFALYFQSLKEKPCPTSPSA